MSKQPPPAPTASAVGPCPTFLQISWTLRHWKLTQHHRTTRSLPEMAADRDFKGDSLLKFITPFTMSVIGKVYFSASNVRLFVKFCIRMCVCVCFLSPNVKQIVCHTQKYICVTMLARKFFQTYLSYFTVMSNSGKTSYIKLLLE